MNNIKSPRKKKRKKKLEVNKIHVYEVCSLYEMCVVDVVHDDRREKKKPTGISIKKTYPNIWMGFSEIEFMLFMCVCV